MEEQIVQTHTFVCVIGALHFGTLHVHVLYTAHKIIAYTYNISPSIQRGLHELGHLPVASESEQYHSFAGGCDENVCPLVGPWCWLVSCTCMHLCMYTYDQTLTSAQLCGR